MEQKGVWQLIYMKLSETQESATGVIFCENCKVKDRTHSQMLGKFEYTGGPIFKVVLEC